MANTKYAVTFSQADAATILNVSRPNIYHKQKRGELPDPVTVESLLEEIESLRNQANEIQRRLFLMVPVGGGE